MAFATLLRQCARRGESLVLGTGQRFLQLIDGYHVLLTLITEGNIDNGKEDNQYKQPYLRANHLCCQQIATQDGAQVQLTGGFRIFLAGRLLN